MAASDPVGSQKFWFSGLPVSGINAINGRDPGTVKFWFNGLPVDYLLPSNFVPLPPSKGGGNGKGQGGDKGNKPPKGGIQFDPYGRYVAYYEHRDEQARLRRRRRLSAAATGAVTTTLGQSLMHGIDEGSVDTTSGLHLIEQGIAA